MSSQIEQLWTILLKSDVVQGALPEASATEKSPWYVKVLLAISGWLATQSILAAFFLFGFMAQIFDSLLENWVVVFILGAILVGFAFGLFRAAKNDFLEHMALSLSLAGQVIMIIAINIFADNDENLFLSLMFLLQLILAILIPGFIHRVLTTIAATISFTVLMNKIGLPSLVTGPVLLLATVCWLNEFRFSRFMSAFRATGYGLILALLLFQWMGMYSFITQDFYWMLSYSEAILPYWIGDILMAVVFLYLVWSILQRYPVRIFETIPVTALLASLLLSLASIEMPGLNIGLVILLLGFLGSNRVLIGLGIVSLLFYISSYYYFLEVTLMEKSQSLFIVGLTLLFIRWFMLHVLLKDKGTKHA
jgi:uncharacterized membrane protein